MIQKIRNRLSLKFSAVLLIAQLITLALLAVAFYSRYTHYLHRNLANIVSTTANGITSGALDPGIVNSKESLDALLGLDVIQALIVDQDGRVTHATDPSLLGRPVSEAGPLFAGMVAGTHPAEAAHYDNRGVIVVNSILTTSANGSILLVEVNDSAIHTRLRQTQWISVLLAIVAVGINTIFLSASVHRNVREPVQVIGSILEHVEAGRYDVRVPVSPNAGEIGVLQRKVNAMIAARERADTEIQHLNRVLHTIRNVNLLITYETDSTTFIDEICRQLTSTGSYRCAWIALVDEDQAIADFSLVAPNLDAQEMDNASHDLCLACVQHVVDRPDEVVSISPSHSECEHCPIMQMSGCSNTLATRLRHEKQMLGVVAVSLPSGIKISDSERKLIREVADDISYALHNFRMTNERSAALDSLAATQARWQHIVNTIPLMLNAFDAEFNLVAWNATCERITGYSPADMVGNPDALQQLYPDPETRQHVLASIRDTSRNQQFAHEWTLTTKAGEQRTIAWTKGSGTPPLPGWSSWAIGIDVTERVHAQQALRESNRHFESLLENPTGYMIFRLVNLATPLEATLTHVSPSAKTLLGLTDEKLYDFQAWFLNIHPDDIEAVLECFDQAGSPPFVVDVEVRYMHPTSGLRWMHIQARGIPREDDDLLFQSANGIIMDITERKRAEVEMRDMLSRLQQAESAANIGFWSQNPQTGEEWWSDYAYTLHGLRPEDHPTPSYLLHLECVHPDDLMKHNREHEQQLRGEVETVDTEYRVIWPDGSIHYILSQGHVDRDASGRALRISGMDQDITHRKASETQMQELLTQVSEQAAQMEQLMNTVPDGIMLLDHELRIQLANPAAEFLLQELAAARTGDILLTLAGQSMGTFIKPPDRPGSWHEISHGSRAYETLAHPVYEDGSRRAWVVMLRDVTDEHTARRYAIQQDRLASVGQLAAGIAHDFNNIMAVIILYAGSCLLSPSLPEDVRERLQTITEQAKTATVLTQQILDFSRRSSLERRPMDLLPFLKEQRHLFQRTLPESIDIELNHGLADYIVNGDPTSLQQVMMNLAVNARDAMPHGGALNLELSAVTINDTYHLTALDLDPGEWICLEVTDTGSGIPDEIMEHLFEPFHTSKAPGKGSGLGLAQVHGIVKQHDGEITVLSTPGEGTTFQIYLPALRVSERQQEKPPSEELLMGNGETVLVVEDNPVMRASLLESLNLLQYKVFEAENGRRALDVIQSHPDTINLVLSDVVMPQMGGIELFRTMRLEKISIPVVLLTGHPRSDEFSKLMDEGLQAWMAKPPSLFDLAKMLYDAVHDPG